MTDASRPPHARYDVAVIGLGAMGAAAAYQLAKRGASVVGVDAYAPPHTLGSSHGETRITRAAVGEGEAYVPLVQASHEIWRELERDTGRDLFVACGLLVMDEPAGGAAVHGETDFLGRTAAIAERYGVAHTLLTSDDIATRFPAFLPTPTTRGYLEPDAGYLKPEACVGAQLDEARRLGAEIRTGVRVTGLDATPHGVTLATSDGPISSAEVVVAAGGWTAPLLGAPFDRLLSIQRQTFHWLSLTPEFPAQSAMPAFIWLHGGADTGQIYGFPPLAGARSLKLATERYGAPQVMDALDRIAAPEDSASLYRDHVAGRLLGVGPHLAKSSVCAYTVTPDFGFIIDRHPEMPRVMVVSACSGHGFKHSAAIGAAIADDLTTQTGAFDLAPFRLARFT